MQAFHVEVLSFSTENYKYVVRLATAAFQNQGCVMVSGMVLGCFGTWLCFLLNDI